MYNIAYNQKFLGYDRRAIHKHSIIKNKVKTVILLEKQMKKTNDNMRIY